MRCATKTNNQKHAPNNRCIIKASEQPHAHKAAYQMSPIKVSEFQELKKAPAETPKGAGRKVDWQKFRDFLQRNKELAYTVKECWQIVNSTCMLAEGTAISRVRVYKELKKMVKKGLVEERYDEGDIGVYNWRHITKASPKASKKQAKDNHPIGWGEHNAPQPVPAKKPEGK